MWQRVAARAHGRARFATASVLHDTGAAMRHSHPHLVKPHEFVPGFTADEFKQRRSALQQRLSTLQGSCALLVPAQPQAVMANDVHFPYRQHSDLLYLCGFPEPESMAIISASSSSPFTLIARERNALREKWDGARCGTSAALALYGADACISIDASDDALAALALAHDTLYFDDKANPYFTEKVRSAVAKAGKQYATIVKPPPATLLASARVVKSPAELEAMRTAASISARAFRDLMHRCEPGMLEDQLGVEFESYCRRRRASRLAYPSIVAGGRNALCLHYHVNNHVLRDGDLVLVDAGCEFNHYASDITRTWPVNGRFSDAQRDLYEAVLDVQLSCIRLCKADGATTLNSLNEHATRALVEALIHLKIITGKSVDECLHTTPPAAVAVASTSPSSSSAAPAAPVTPSPPLPYKAFWPHSVSHYLGMDVHDTSAVGKTTPLAAGTVVTIEPGLYIPLSNARFGGLGIRIEDDIVVGVEGPEILTAAAPKRVDEIEEVCRLGRDFRRTIAWSQRVRQSEAAML